MLCASCKASSDLPTAVGPSTISSLGFIESCGGNLFSNVNRNPETSHAAPSPSLAKNLNHALEHSFQFVAADLDQHRSTVRALRGEINLIQIAEQSLHLVHFKHAIGAN